MKRVIATIAMAFGLLLPGVPAQADHNPRCTEVWIHFRPTYCSDTHDGYTWFWICPDRYGGCFTVGAPFTLK